MYKRGVYHYLFSYFSYLVIVASVLFMTACTTISLLKTPLSPMISNQKNVSSKQNLHPNIELKINQALNNHQSTLNDLNNWKASGVIGIIINHKCKSANFIWKQNNQDFWIQTYGPLGIGATTFSGNNNKVELKRSNGEIIKAQSLERLMQSQLGWSLPLEGLYYWVRGLYMPQASYSIVLNNFGFVQSLKQQGWEIQYKDYMLYDNQHPLARRIMFYYGNNFKITLVIKSWLLSL